MPRVERCMDRAVVPRRRVTQGIAVPNSGWLSWHVHGIAEVKPPRPREPQGRAPAWPAGRRAGPARPGFGHPATPGAGGMYRRAVRLRSGWGGRVGHSGGRGVRLARTSRRRPWPSSPRLDALDAAGQCGGVGEGCSGRGRGLLVRCWIGAHAGQPRGGRVLPGAPAQGGPSRRIAAGRVCRLALIGFRGGAGFVTRPSRRSRCRAGLCRVGVRCARTGRSRGRAAACPARGPGAGAARSAAATRTPRSC